ncbi:hypothetical protein F511_43290 [Dorcoceras hygrometricum]|uniref:Uncharacterized protein n=1 Tax=Dorcoceras hygrometricum TaxID=472368 RepID=A0A2Z7CSQ1_9LAMI|nr:hypothetical protein F511_43290 [Dorcoceras hygrometricum]
MGLRDEGIDQLNFHSAQLGYLKLLQMGTQTQQDKAGNKYEVKPQYEELSKQPISRWKSSVRDHRGPSAHHSAVETLESGSHHSDDSVGLFGHDSTVGQSQRGTQSAATTKQQSHENLQNDTVPTYLNDAVANTSRQQLSCKQNNHLLVTALSPKHSICWLREITQNDDASTNSNDVTSQRSCISAPADQQ